MRKDLVLVMIFRHSTTPGTFCRGGDKSEDGGRFEVIFCNSVYVIKVMITYLVLQAAVFSLSVLPDDHDVDVFVACPHSW